MVRTLTRRGFVALPVVLGGLCLSSCAIGGSNDAGIWLISKIKTKRTSTNDLEQIETIEYDDRGRIRSMSPRTIHSEVKWGGTDRTYYEYDTTTERFFTWHDDNHVTEEVKTARVIQGGKIEEFTDTFDFEFNSSFDAITLTGAIVNGEKRTVCIVNDAEINTYEVEYEGEKVSTITAGDWGCKFYKGVPLSVRENLVTKWAIIDESKPDHLDVKITYVDHYKGDEPVYDDYVCTYNFDDCGNIATVLVDGETSVEYGYIRNLDPAKSGVFCSAIIMAGNNNGIIIMSDEMVNLEHPIDDSEYWPSNQS